MNYACERGGGNARERMRVCVCVGRKEDEKDLHSKREFCMRQAHPGKIL